MPAYRKLPSGLHQMTVRYPNGKRISRTNKLKRVVADWARDEEVRIARGEWRDARSGRVTYDEWRDRWVAARVVEPETARRDAWAIPKHLDPQWSGWKLPAITRMEVQGWVKGMQKAEVGHHSIRVCYYVLSAMLNAAVDEGIILENPCRRVELPATPRKLPEWFTREQVDSIAAELTDRYAAATHLMAWCGLRWGEMAGLKIGRVAFLRRRLSVVGVNSQRAEWKEYPKSSKSRREVPVPQHILDMLAPLATGKGPDDLLFLTVRGARPWSGANWRARWYHAIGKAQNAHPELAIPAYSPHSLRHSAASWLVQDGVPLYDVQKLLGHESFEMTMRYSHLAPDAHGSVEQAWERFWRRRDPGESGRS